MVLELARLGVLGFGGVGRRARRVSRAVVGDRDRRFALVAAAVAVAALRFKLNPLVWLAAAALAGALV